MLRDEVPIVRQAVTTEKGFLFESIVGWQDAFDLSDNGRSIILEATLPGSIRSAFLIDIGSDCPWNLDGNGSVGRSDLLANWGPSPWDEGTGH